MSDVSRETPPPPSVAEGVFASALPRAIKFASLLGHEGVTRGLIGPREVPRLWARHLLNCAVVGDAIGDSASVCDLGSGAGLPGMVLAIRRPDLRVTLVEPLLRRTTFLEEVVSELGLENVEVLRARAEELQGHRTFDVVTSRAVAPLERLLGWSLPLARPGGEVVAMKGRTVHEEIPRAQKVLRRWGAGKIWVEELGSGVLEPATIVARVEASSAAR